MNGECEAECERNQRVHEWKRGMRWRWEAVSHRRTEGVGLGGGRKEREESDLLL